MPSPLTPTVQMRIRVYLGGEPALGPGRAELLARIRDTASIAQSARDMGMSYMKAWKLVQSLNGCFKTPAVEVRRGGRAGGEAHLTPLGEHALALYQRMEAASRAAVHDAETEMATLFRTDGQNAVA